MNPEQTHGYIASIRGPNSTGKSELARAISAGIQEQNPKAIPRVVHVGDMFRFFADHGIHEIPPDDITALRDSAHQALAKVHVRVDEATGEIRLTYNGDSGADVVQTANNGFNAAVLGTHGDLNAIVHWYIRDQILSQGKSESIFIFDGRERFDPDGLVIHTHAILPTRLGFFQLERPEASTMSDGEILEKIQKRDEQEEKVLMGSVHDTRHVIDVIRTDPKLETTEKLGKVISGIILQCVDGKPPANFGSVPLTIRDKDI